MRFIPWRWRNGLLAVLLGWVQASAAAQPVGLDRDEAGLWMLVDRHEQYLRTSNKFLADRRLNGALHSLTCKTVGRLCDNLRVYAIRAPGFNAFMMPNGAMFVQSGLLLRISDDAELAAVLGHEASHFTRRHSVMSMRRWHRTASGFAMVGALVSAAGSVASASATTYEGVANAQNMSNTATLMLQTASVVAAFQLVAYDRAQERQADEEGFEWMRKNGLDVSGAHRIWGKLVEEQAAGGKESGFSLLATHPTPQERLSYLSDMASESRMAAADPQITGEGEAAETIRPLVDAYRMDWIVDEMEVQSPEQFAAIVSAQTEFGILPGYAAYLEGKSWASHAKSLKGRQQREALAQAADAFGRGASSESGMPAEGYREWAKVNVRRGDTESAQRNFEKYLALDPDAWDADYIRRTMERL